MTIDNTPTGLDAHDPAEMLAYIPHRFGFMPSESLVILSVSQIGEGRAGPGLAARMSLADLAVPQVAEQTRARLLGQLMQDRCLQVHMAVYSEDPGSAQVEEILQPWLEMTELVAAERVYLVGPQRWRCLGCGHEPPCPQEGREPGELERTAIAAEMVMAGSVVAPSREDIARMPAVGSGARAAAREHYRASGFSGSTVRGRGRRGREDAAMQRWCQEKVRLWQQMLTAQADPTAQQAGRLLAGLRNVLVRDSVLVSVIAGEPILDAEAPEAFGALTSMMRGTGPHADPGPRRAQIERAVTLLALVAAHAEPEASAPPLCVAAWLCWWLGDGARAQIWLEQAFQAEPGYSMGHLLDDILEAGMRPGWARTDL